MKIQYDSSIQDDKRVRLENEVSDFYEIFEPIEKVIYLLMDKVTGAVFGECHVSAKNLINNCTVDVPLDPEEQSDYRANRELVEDSSAFAQMKIDANNGRIFSNIVAEYNVEFDEELEYKIVGSTEANSLKGKISNESPVGKALMGCKVGDSVEVETQAGTFAYKVLEIQRSN